MTVTEPIFTKPLLAGQLSVKNTMEFNGKPTNDFIADSRSPSHLVLLHNVFKNKASAEDILE
jgi:hypothetical protein